ncbi:MAG: hypothetical protein EOP05_00290 [Proteobacteria bacterium]|nr:MAG: hypothetical protein EOP05_00290 [Pseudomonadota bacterium]
MYRLLLCAILVATFQEYGWKAQVLYACRNEACLKKAVARSREITKVNWKPIVLFSKEAAQFK